MTKGNTASGNRGRVAGAFQTSDGRKTFEELKAKGVESSPNEKQAES